MNPVDPSPAELLVREAEGLLAGRQLPAILALFDKAQAAGADSDRCSAGRWLTNMLLGDFERAWHESDAIRKRGAPDPHRLWQGETLWGKRVILRCLHGFGDAVQFLRYAPRLRSLASRLIVEVNPRLMPLANRFAGIDEVICWGDHAPVHAPEWDVQVEIMELPYIFRTQLNDLPLLTKYLPLLGPADADRRYPSVPRSGRTLQVGLAWTSGVWNPARSLPFASLDPLLQIPGCEFWNLQGAPEGETSGESMALRQDELCRNSIEGLAATISRLDLVITVDTLAVHLAGALGIPAWLMLQHAADWRWMHERLDSPWYPSLRLFRQPRPGDWSSVIGEITTALHQNSINVQSQ